MISPDVLPRHTGSPVISPFLFSLTPWADWLDTTPPPMYVPFRAQELSQRVFNETMHSCHPGAV